jgi:hypothetical protein
VDRSKPGAVRDAIAALAVSSNVNGGTTCRIRANTSPAKDRHPCSHVSTERRDGTRHPAALMDAGTGLALRQQSELQRIPKKPMRVWSHPLPAQDGKSKYAVKGIIP